MQGNFDVQNAVRPEFYLKVESKDLKEPLYQHTTRNPRCTEEKQPLRQKETDFYCEQCDELLCWSVAKKQKVIKILSSK